MASRPICKFWQSGNCKFGDECKFNHPRNTGPRQDNNRYAPLNDTRNYNGSNSRDYGNDPRSHSRNQRDPPRQSRYNERDIDQEQMRKELKNELPIWILSCYSPRADLPRQLFEGADRELSSEEVRLRHYELEAQGQTEVAIQEAEAVYKSARSQVDDVLKDTYGAVKYLQAGFDEHPNRVDKCGMSNSTGSFSPGNASQVSTTNPGLFGQQQTGAGAAASAFGQPSGSTTFGQPSSAFGQPSGSTPTLGFAQPTGIAPMSAFGKPSTLGSLSSFGQPSTVAPVSGFGKPSTLGATPAFGQPSSFGQPSAMGQKPAFGQQLNAPQTAFGQPSNLTSKVAFGQPSGVGSNQPLFGQAPQTTGPAFGQPSNPFSQQPAQNNMASGQTNGLFGRKSSMDSSMQMSPVRNSSGPPNNMQSMDFGKPSGGFGQPTSNGSMSRTASMTSGFGQPSTASRGFGAPSQPAVNTARSAAVNGIPGKLQNWKGKQVQYVNGQPCYRENDGTWQRIWFPEGPPAQLKPDILPPDIPYDAETEECYLYAKQSGQFKDGIIPLLPPKKEWTSWEF